jgi:hypothetical protein
VSATPIVCQGQVQPGLYEINILLVRLDALVGFLLETVQDIDSILEFDRVSWSFIGERITQKDLVPSDRSGRAPLPISPSGKPLTLEDLPPSDTVLRLLTLSISRSSKRHQYPGPS